MRDVRFNFRVCGFTLIELLVVIAIIVIMATITVPAVKSLTKGNDISQAANLVQAMVSGARGIAISQHRMAGVVFFEETGLYSRPVNSNQTAMQLFVEAYNQNGVGGGNAGFVSYSSQRQYLPSGIKLAALNDTDPSLSNASLNTAENTTDNFHRTRAILFDANGQLVLRNGLMTLAPNNGVPGTYPQAYGDWKFINSFNVTDASSSPGFFLYSKTDYDAQGFGSPGNDVNRAAWLKQHADVIIINAFTGNMVR